jgi:hypothetical protein
MLSVFQMLRIPPSNAGGMLSVFKRRHFAGPKDPKRQIDHETFKIHRSACRWRANLAELAITLENPLQMQGNPVRFQTAALCGSEGPKTT